MVPFFLKVRGFKVAARYLILFSFPLVTMLLIKDAAPSTELYAVLVAIYCYIFYGFTVNDYFDSQVLGEKNALSKLKHPSQLALLFGSVALGLSMFIIIRNWLCFAIYMAAIFYGLAYSIPGIRLKNRTFHGAANIVFTEYLAQLLLLIVFFNLFNLLSMLFLVMFSFLGLSNLLNHYMLNYDEDRKQGIRTLAHLIGRKRGRRVLKITSYTTIMLFLMVVVLISFYVPLLFVALPVTVLYLGFADRKNRFPRMYDVVITHGLFIVTTSLLYLLLMLRDMGFSPMIVELILLRDYKALHALDKFKKILR